MYTDRNMKFIKALVYKSLHLAISLHDICTRYDIFLSLHWSVVITLHNSILVLCLYFVFTRRRSYASALLRVVILSLRLYVTRVLCDNTKQCPTEILVLHERAFALVF